MYSAIVYDLDGTLVDSAMTVTALLNDLRIEYGLPPLAINHYKPWLSTGGKAMIAAALGIDEAEAGPLLLDFRARYLNQPTDPASVYPDVHLTLSTLRSAGIRLGLCTNKPRTLTDKVLTETALGDFFDVVCAGQDLSTSKPHPDNLNVCLQGLNSQPEETLVIGDSKIDQCLAEACGTSFAFFFGGYDDGVRTEASVLTLHHHPEIFNLFSSIKKRSHHE
ncbi:MAG: HAD-IA family hydrolase [Rhodocyclaceae bacterium]|nr:HAD-IA family hydrolase [Rhodocyclaceae bacterium]